MQPNPSRYAKGSPCNKEILRILPRLSFLLRFFLTTFHHFHLFWARLIHFKFSHTIVLRYILILSYRPFVGLPSGLSSSGFPIKAFHAFFMTHAFHMFSPSHLSWYDHPKNILPGVKFMEPHIMQFSPASCHSPSFRPKYFLKLTILEPPQPIFLPQRVRPIFILI
jgi:hypothetical protein